MAKKYFLIAITAVFSSNAFCQTYITHVTLVDVEKRILVPDQSVEIKEGIITAVKASKNMKIAPGSTVIDGTGKFLMPGMTDAHVHFFQSGGLYSRPDGIDLRNTMPYEKEIEWVHAHMEDFLRRYVRAGITTVFDVGASNKFLMQRDTFTGKSYAPTIYMTGPLLTSYESDVYKKLGDDAPFSLISTAADAKKFIDLQLPYHPDFIKIWYIVNSDSVEASARAYLPVVKAIIDEAHKQNLKVAVHATERITAQLAVENGCDYLVHCIEDEVVPESFLKLLKEKKTIISPTLFVPSGYEQTFAQTIKPSLYELTTSNPEAIGSLYDLRHLTDTALTGRYKRRFTSAGALAYFKRGDSLRAVNIKKIADAGIMIAAGSDAGNIGTQHASSFYCELLAMQKSGLTTWQILQSATINPSYILGMEKQTGSIVTGKKADMILLDKNPVDSIGNLLSIYRVVNKGTLIDPDSLIKETPLRLVQRQLNAYNALNIEAFLEPYADDVELYEFPGKLIGKGKAAMRKEYGEMFRTLPDLHCEIKQRIIQGNMVIDKESVSGMGPKPMEATAIYYIENNKISKVYFGL